MKITPSFCFPFEIPDDPDRIYYSGTILTLLMELANNSILVDAKETITTTEVWKLVKVDVLWISLFQLKKTSNSNFASCPWLKEMSEYNFLNLHLQLWIYICNFQFTSTTFNLHIKLSIYIYNFQFTSSTLNLHIQLWIYIYNFLFTSSTFNLHLQLFIYIFNFQFTSATLNSHLQLSICI